MRSALRNPLYRFPQDFELRAWDELPQTGDRLRSLASPTNTGTIRPRETCRLGYTAPMLTKESVVGSHPSRGFKRSVSFAVVMCLVMIFFAASGATAQKKSKKDKAKPQDQLQFGVDMAQRGLWSEALFRFKQAHRQDPNNARILNNLAISYEALGLFDLALEHYRKALELDSTNKVLRRNYARFVEFYQSFNPPEQGEEGVEADENAPPGAPKIDSKPDGGATDGLRFR